MSDKGPRLIKSMAIIACATLILLEVSLQLHTHFFHKLTTNKKSELTRPSLRVLALGESTTAAASALPKGSDWPNQLEKILIEKGIHTRVYNEGRGATTTTFLVNRLADNLERYQPQIVISMMGINDHNFFWLKEQDPLTFLGFFKNLKVLRLVAHFVFRKESMENPAAKLIAYGVDDGRAKPSALKAGDTRPWISRAESGDLDGLYRDMEASLSLKTPQEKAQVYAHLGNHFKTFEDKGLKYQKVALFFYEKAIQKSYNVYFLPEEYLGKVYEVHNFLDPDRCYEIALKTRKSVQQLSDVFVNRIGRCAVWDKNIKRWQNYFEDLGLVWSETEGFQTITQSNYLRAAKILKSKGVIFIAMQYPVRSVKGLQALFAKTNSKDRPDFFLSNEVAFKKALSEKPFEEVFVDQFGDDFGHCTEFGNSLIAQSAAELVLKIWESRLAEESLF